MARGKKKGSGRRRRGIGNRIIFPRRKTSALNALPEVPFKDVELLKGYITERGRIVPRRISGNTARTQRALTLAIKRARNIALLSFAEGYTPQD